MKTCVWTVGVVLEVLGSRWIRNDDDELQCQGLDREMACSPVLESPSEAGGWTAEDRLPLCHWLLPLGRGMKEALLQRFPEDVSNHDWDPCRRRSWYLKLLVGQALLLFYPLCHLVNAHHNPVRKVLFSTPHPPTFQVRRPTFRDIERLALDHTDGTWQSWGLTGPVPKPRLETCLPLQEAEQDFQPTASSSRVWAEVEMQSFCPLGSGLAFPSIQGDKTSPDFGQPGVDSNSDSVTEGEAVSFGRLQEAAVGVGTYCYQNLMAHGRRGISRALGIGVGERGSNGRFWQVRERQ